MVFQFLYSNKRVVEIQAPEILLSHLCVNEPGSVGVCVSVCVIIMFSNKLGWTLGSESSIRRGSLGVIGVGAIIISNLVVLKYPNIGDIIQLLLHRLILDQYF